MKIAVTYDNGEIFQHFGKTESFKVYEVEDNKVVSSEVIGSNGTGHGALSALVFLLVSVLQTVLVWQSVLLLLSHMPPAVQ